MDRCSGGNILSSFYNDSVFSVKWEAKSLAESENVAGDVDKVRREGRRHKVVI